RWRTGPAPPPRSRGSGPARRRRSPPRSGARPGRAGGRGSRGRSVDRGGPDEAGVDGRGMVGQSPLEQEVARGVGGGVVLEGAEVEGPLAPAEVRGQELAGGALADQAAVGAEAGVLAPEGGAGGHEVGAL